MGINKRAWELLRQRATHSLFSIGQAKRWWWADCMRQAYREAHPQPIKQLKPRPAAMMVKQVKIDLALFPSANFVLNVDEDQPCDVKAGDKAVIKRTKQVQKGELCVTRKGDGVKIVPYSGEEEVLGKVLGIIRIF